MNSRRQIGLAILVLLLPATACVMPEQLSKMQKDINDVREQLRRVQSDQKATRDAMARMEAGNEGGQVRREEHADLVTRVERVARDTAVVEERMTDLDRRLETVANNAQRALSQSRRSGGITPPAAIRDPSPSIDTARPAVEVGEGVIPDANELYNTAYADFSKGNYGLAIDGFDEYQRRFTDNPLADNAVYWVGECRFSQGSFEKAIQAFDRLLERYPDSDKAAASNLKKGLAYLELNQIGESIVQLRYVVAEFPGSDEANIASDKLASLNASP
ncbi:MAG: tol-pal system protein YbgF [Acidobacteriota bacterium]|nr:tol-pal system protein YbgF [Acidobacteriota bacterium]